MSTIYEIISGDTFESVARVKYGFEGGAASILAANPGIQEPLIGGTLIVVPALAESPKNTPNKIVSENENEVAIIVDGARFRFWDAVQINKSIDRMDVVELTAPFDPNVTGFKETFTPFSFKSLDVLVGGEPFFTGTMVAVTPSVSLDEKIISVSAYSLPGVLGDCTPSASSYPLEFDGLGLKQIATQLAAPFGISVKFEADSGAVFERVAIEPGTKILSFLIELAQQRNLVISNTSRGELLFLQSAGAGDPVTRIEQGQPPVEAVHPAFNEQDYYSDVTGIEPVSFGFLGSQFTVKNSRLKGVTRPFTFKLDDTLGGDVKEVVEAKAGRMFANAISYSVDVAAWRDSSGSLWVPNSTLVLFSPNAMIYREFEFLIRAVRFNRAADSETATLDLVIPGAFKGQIPEVLPWDL